MCFKCELRDRAAEGDKDAAEMLNLLNQDQLLTVWPFIVQALMRQLGETSITVNVSDVDTGPFAGLMVNRADDEFTVCLVQREELDVVKDLARDSAPHSVN